MKKREMEISIFRFISEFRRQISISGSVMHHCDISWKEVFWDSLKMRLKEIPNQRWLIREMNEIDKFLELDEVKELTDGYKIHDLI